MSKKNPATLTTQSQRWFITIRKNIDLPINVLKQWCDIKSEGDMYAFIEHKGDISVDTGEVEGVHYHIAINTKGRPRKLTLLNDIVKTFSFDNPYGIEVDTYDTFEGCVQYLIHKNEPKKTKHKPNEIITNIDDELLNAILETPIKAKLSSNFLIEAIERSRSLIDLCGLLGLGTFHAYLSTIKVLWKEIKGD